MSIFKRFLMAISTKEFMKKTFPECIAYIIVTLLILWSGLNTFINLVLYSIVTILVIIRIAVVSRNIMRRI